MKHDEQKLEMAGIFLMHAERMRESSELMTTIGYRTCRAVGEVIPSGRISNWNR